MTNLFDETTALARRTTVTELCRAWTESTDQIRDGFAKIVSAQDIMAQVFQGGSHGLNIQSYRHDAIDFKDPDKSIRYFKREVWRAIIEQLGIRKLLSLKRLAELDKQLENGEGLPEITPDNINAMLETNLAQMGDFLKEKVHEVYKWLRPGGYRRTDYKTNQKSAEAGVGRKVILWGIENNYSGGFRVSHYRIDEYRAIDQLFHMLDGKAPPTSYYGELVEAIQKTTLADNKFETTYFRGRCFRNHNCHLEIKREDLLAQFNLIAGGARITDTKKFTHK